jgi:hypothetical protein
MHFTIYFKFNIITPTKTNIIITITITNNNREKMETLVAQEMPIDADNEQIPIKYQRGASKI